MFFLDAPEPIKVNVEETHIVNCYGSNEGVLEAHVTGGVRCDYPKMPYVYHWYEMKKDGTLKEFEQERDSVLKDIPAGKYCIIATDSNQINSEPVEYSINYRPKEMMLTSLIVISAMTCFMLMERTI